MTLAYLASMQATATSASSDVDGVNLLLSMNDDTVRQKVGEAFVLQMQNAHRVQSAFFGSPPALIAPMVATLDDWIGQVASALIALSLSHTSGHGFAATVNAGVAQNFVDGALKPSNGQFVAVAKANYASLFAAYCQTADATPVPFRSFLNGERGNTPQRWGTLLADTMTSNAWITQELAKLNPGVDPGGWYQRFYANVYKVHCLNAGETDRVVQSWKNFIHDNASPTDTSWTIYDHMVAGSYNYSTFFSSVSAAINQSHSSSHINGCQGGPAAHCSSTTTTTYGPAVNDWLSGNTGLGGFISGPSRSNEESNGGGGGCCFIAGTPILMADGSSQPIEQVGAGSKVVSRDGQVLPRSPQDVHWPIDEHDLLYGFNEYAPFFNASHPFMTTDGWKSMSPAASKRLNADMPIAGALAVGDVVLQAVPGTTPLRYREVRIEQITRVLAGAVGCNTVHSLHIDAGNPGYHAHGFLVAVNYPTLREDHFVNAFAGITPAEREYLRGHFSAIAPFLRRGLGNYITEILQRSLGGSHTDYGASIKVAVIRE